MTAGLTFQFCFSIFVSHSVCGHDAAFGYSAALDGKTQGVRGGWGSEFEVFGVACHGQFHDCAPARCCRAQDDDSEMFERWGYHYSAGVRVFVCMSDVTRLYVWRDSFMYGRYTCVRLYEWRDSFVCVTWRIHVCHMTHACVWHASFVICMTGIRVVCLIHMCDMTHAYEWHASFICVTWLIHMCDMTHSYVWHDSCIWVAWLIHTCDMTHSYVWHDSFIRVTWLMHMCDMTHSYEWHDSFICVTWLIHMCDMTHSYSWHDSFMCVTWLIHLCNMTNSYVWHDSFICVTWCIHMCAMSPWYSWHDSLTFFCVYRVILVCATHMNASSICVAWPLNIRHAQN